MGTESISGVLRRGSQTLRHAPGLRLLTPLWDVLRRPYQWTLRTLSGGRGVPVQVGGHTLRLDAKFSGLSWETIEDKSYRAFAASVRPGAVVYDIGAHIGTYTLVALQHCGENGRVVAFEPFETTRRFLNEHLRMNGVADRVIVRDVSCGAEQGQAEMFFFPGMPEGETGLIAVPGAQTMPVAVRTLDAEVADIGLPPTLLKIDVEGWEGHVLRGAEQTLKQYRPELFLSLHPEALEKIDSSAEQVLAWLAERGYSATTIDRDHEWHVQLRPNA